jgi:hypothetical protein
MSATTETGFDYALFMKFMGHLDNDNDHELLSAVKKARKELGKGGWRFSELPKLFPSPTSTFDFDLDEVVRQAQREAEAQRRRDEEERRRKAEEELATMRRWAEEQEREQEELRRRLEPQRQALIEKYGSEHAARAARGLERSIETAYRLAIKELQIARRPWDRHPDSDIPEEVIAAIRRPGPFPTTITAANVELSYWIEREDELAILNYAAPGSSEFLSRECRERRRMVELAFQTGIRATSLAEVILRQRVHVESDVNDITDENAEALPTSKPYRPRPRRLLRSFNLHTPRRPTGVTRSRGSSRAQMARA